MEQRRPKPYLGDWVRLDGLADEWVRTQPSEIQPLLRASRGGTFRTLGVSDRTLTLEVSGGGDAAAQSMQVPVWSVSADTPRLRAHFKQPTIHEVLHVGRGELDSLGSAGARRLAVSRDTLDFGPAHADDRRHVALRIEWWKRGFGIAPGRSFVEPTKAKVRAAAQSVPVVVWANDEWPSQLNLWRFAGLWSRLRRENPLWLAQPNAQWRATRTMPRVFGVLSPFDLAPMFAAASAVRAAQRRTWERGWAAWCSNSLASLERHRAAHAGAADVLARVHFAATLLVPRYWNARPWLSWLDDALLSSLDVRAFWSSSDLVRRWRSNHIIDIIERFADRVIAARLLTWARQRPDAVEVEWGDEKGSEWFRAAFRLTAHGQRLVERGLSSVADAPPFPCGGWAAYDATRPWAWEGDERRWRFVKLRRGR